MGISHVMISGVAEMTLIVCIVDKIHSILGGIGCAVTHSDRCTYYSDINLKNLRAQIRKV